MATFDATKPANTRFRVNIFLAIQPAAMYRALHGVYAGLVDGVRAAGHSNEHVYPSVELYRTLHPTEPQWYEARRPVFALEPPDSYFITWLSREQSGFGWRFKTFSDEIIIKILPNDQLLVRGGVRANSVDDLTRDNNGMPIKPRSV